MAISPMWVGQTLPVWSVVLVDSNGVPVNLTGATLNTLITNTQSGGQTFTGAGSWLITNAAAGLATYSWAATDTEAPGQYSLQVIATFSGGIREWQPVPWLLKPKGQI